MYNQECCRCFRQTPKNAVRGDACDEAIKQGFINISIMYWINKPISPHINPYSPSIYSKLCSSCQNIKLFEYLKMLHGFLITQDYNHFGGAGSHWNLNCRYESRFDSYITCAKCRQEYHRNRDDYDKVYKDGWIVVGCGENGSLSFCPDCPKKITIKDIVPLHKEWKAIADKRTNSSE